MYLKRIELTGFKSFTTKTRISFEPGVSCIVGPNGSGKSNIADAVRWVMGENSARNIRGDKMEDVIFSGSNSRRPLGMAEVSIILDNSDNYLPLAFSEVSVTRRAIRNGASEYFINEAPCRLKDIRELFMDTGVGVDGLSLINQGRINELIAARPEERRCLVEEAAGIVKYRDRKREAARRLSETERHLERVGDIIYELSGRVEPLRQQSEKAKQYLSCKEEADRLEIGISVKVLSEADEKISAIDQQLQSQEESMLAEDSQRMALAAEMEQLHLALSAMDEAVAADNDAFHQLQTRRERAEGERKLALSQRENNESMRERLTRELRQSEEMLALRKKDAEDLAAHVSRTEAELTEQQNFVQSGAGGGEELQERAATLGEQWNELNRRAADLAAKKSAAEANQTFKQELITRSQESLRKLQEEAEEIEQQRADASRELRRLDDLCAEIAQESKGAAQASNENEAKMRALSEETQNLAADEAECRFRCHSLETRVSMLTEMAASYEGFFPGVKGLMAAKKQGKAPQGVIGIMAELMEVPAAYQAAVETYLGANIQNIVTEDADAAKAAVDYLKTQRLGRATFLPLDILKVRAAEDFSRVLSRPGVCGRASELVQIEARLRPALDFLLNHVLIVETMDVALAVAKELRYRFSIVTMDGDMVNPGASISGGSKNSKNGSLLSQKYKLDEARQDLETAQKELAIHSEKLAQNRKRAAKATLAQEQLREALRELSRRLQEAEREKEQYRYRGDTLEERAAAIVKERRHAQDELAAQEEEYAEAEREADGLATEEKMLQSKIDGLQVDLAAVEEEVAVSREAMTKKRVALAATEQKLRGQRISLENLHEAINDLTWEAEEKAADLADAEKEGAACREVITTQEALLREMGLKIHDAEEKLEHARHGMAAESARLMELEKAEKELSHKREKRQDEMHQLQLRRERWQADFENEALKLAEKFALDLPQAKAKIGEMPARTVMITQLNQLKREIAALGNVNLDAIAEYQEVSERYTFLTTQREDLLAAKAKLNTVIKEMDAIMISRFRDAFTRLSQAFDASFHRLFAGGRAALLLSDPENLLETGVEISVHLPGKKVNNYNLLSGGEKSLIGIALMFAMLTVRPTPFCVMDEVDAALDEANIDRFTAYLQDKAEMSQFIMISHRQTTMEAANVLWGITMEEEGVSKVISVRLTESDAAVEAS